ncbi:RNA polymerase sigma factor [Flavobacteriaceae bacterium LMO-SS05]
MGNIKHENIKDLFLKHYEELCLYSYTYLHSMDEAEDVVQDIFVKILTLENRNEILNLKSYVYAMVRNHSLKKIKKLSKIISLNEENSTTLSSYEDLIINKELNLKVQKALEDLPPQTKNVFVLCVLENLKYESAAEKLGVSINTIKYHLKKSFKLLRTSLKNLHQTVCFFGFNDFFDLLLC